MEYTQAEMQTLAEAIKAILHILNSAATDDVKIETISIIAATAYPIAIKVKA